VRIRAAVALAAAIAAGPMVYLGLPTPPRAAQAQQQPLSFKADILPILNRPCMPCHAPGGAGEKADGIVLNSYAGVMKGTKYGPMVVPGKPAESNLMRLLDWQVAPELRMPHNENMLPQYERDAIRTWIREGAQDN
jgi:Planctomycete cytochrome C